MASLQGSAGTLAARHPAAGSGLNLIRLLRGRRKESSAHVQVLCAATNPAIKAGEVPHPEEQDMDLLALEGELTLRCHLQEQFDSLEHLKLCP